MFAPENHEFVRAKSVAPAIFSNSSCHQYSDSRVLSITPVPEPLLRIASAWAIKSAANRTPSSVAGGLLAKGAPGLLTKNKLGNPDVVAPVCVFGRSAH